MTPPKNRGIGGGAAVRKIARPTTAATSTASTATTAQQPSATTPLLAPREGAGGSIVAALQRQGSRAGAEVLALDPRQIAEHPDNPREALSDLDGLVSSMRELGVLQPLIVVPREEHLAAHPHHAEHVGEKPWVVLAGHRRRAAALEAGLPTVPALTRADLADKRSATRIFLAENVHRQQLAPLEEARAFSVLVDLGLSQRTIATENGVSQAHVSKRLRLLKLPAHLQDALRSGELAIGDALVLADAPAQDRDAAFLLAQQRNWPMSTVVGHIAQQRESATHPRGDRAAATADAEEAQHGQQGDEEQRGSGAPAARTAPRHTTAQPAPLRQAGDDSSHGAQDAGQVDSSVSSPDDSDDAVRRRAAACARLTRTAPSTARQLADLSAAVVQGMVPTADVLTCAHEWIGDLLGAPEADAQAWRATVPASEQPRLAWTLAIASLNLNAAQPGRTWEAADVHLAEQLSRVGWVPTPAEAARLQQTGLWAAPQITAEQETLEGTNA
ncbi:ParB/RepB/Spo0J family partition protein [Kineococcus indalonis]|uniref:ParB/RepB/Spo0J family partition protein n=1 Tax=Kineococcus indalonis TaxID=2696566 RepID=UPI001412764B|nr:ParB/RepB/Spo0J family partition protein [Kineococcus indalonis]NAZ84581.1 ParB/RepB/Spo0J family partition protein [Kineococcus indalonis]